MGESESGNDEVDEFDDGSDFDDAEVVTFTDDEGASHSCLVLAVVEHKGQEYAMLAPVAQLKGGDEDDLELFLFRYEVDEDDTEVFSYIDDERTFAAVQALCEGLMG